MKPIKHKKMDPNFVSSEKWEIAYVAKKFHVSVDVVRNVKNMLGKSRRKLYTYLRGVIQ
jgi:hypothetical protein